METIRQILKRRDGLDDFDIDDLFRDCAEEFACGADAEDVLADNFQLEPDYLFDAEFQAKVLCI